MLWLIFILGVAVAICVPYLILGKNFPDMRVGMKILGISFAYIWLIIWGLFYIKKVAVRAKMRNNPLLYEPIAFGLSLMVVGCVAMMTFNEFFGAPFVFCSFGLIITILGIHLWKTRNRG